ncbi:ATP-binding cassette domain-containing protein [Kaistia dalseonensis]|uniref:Sulfonate transport system ATP-binding protein n=1 Tax=Kaistia dalseonensis TaxID=410840 RepID=A0ABU0HDP6_9HYPH|nr:ATP-binding cassette domain-containing protein [Kaistia dalseonensis]MCX5497810.1 ATP-binding cassette domain-containing protein [Kaistia dalseonensis]MDQ0440454.1 sulfonate transport system ATP-binding protein [Kaistia dalseonensis]
MFADAMTFIETATRRPPRELTTGTAVPFEVLTEVAPTRGQGSALSIRGLVKTFDQEPVIKGLDLDIPAGQFVAVVGKSGCGKSTLLRLILGLETPTSGSIEGVGATGGTARFIFQEPRLLPWATVADNVAVGLGRSGSRTSRRKAALKALSEVGLDGRGDAWPAVLSGGQRQRVALARALVSHPRLLALDEPLGALDALTRISMQGLVERVWQDQGFTAILVTHDVSEAIALADRVLLIDNGRIALDLAVDLPRPRRRGTPAFAALEKTVLDTLFGFEGGEAI